MVAAYSGKAIYTLTNFSNAALGTVLMFNFQERTETTDGYAERIQVQFLVLTRKQRPD